MSEPLLRIRNKHILECGDPPIINNDDPNLYVGYFETRDREQWVFTYDLTTRDSKLQSGDCGWDQVFRIEHGDIDELILEPEVRQWLSACADAAIAASGGTV